MLPDTTQLGYVHLIVADLERSLTFYQQRLGFQLHRRQGDTVWLGAGAADILIFVCFRKGPEPSRMHWRAFGTIF